MEVMQGIRCLTFETHSSNVGVLEQWRWAMVRRHFNVVEDWNLTFEAAGFGPAVLTRLPSLPGGFGDSLISHGSSTSGVVYSGLNQVP